MSCNWLISLQSMGNLCRATEIMNTILLPTYYLQNGNGVNVGGKLLIINEALSAFLGMFPLLPLDVYPRMQPAPC